ncbi:MAG: hypothetical protein V3R78_09985 [Thermodesulfobacteriota bacterium]
MKIYKYELHSHAESVELPKGAKVISVIAQNNKVVMYALVETLALLTEPVPCEYKILPTGGTDLPAYTFEAMSFISTVDLYQDGSLILHIFVDKTFVVKP